MALLMDTGSDPISQKEIEDYDAIQALKESAAIELKEEGNRYIKLGKKHYSHALDCYSRAINQNSLSDSETSVIYSNRSHVNLLLGNYRRALVDAEKAIKLSSSNVKAAYRAAKASLSLNLLAEAESHSKDGLALDPSNEDLRKLLKKISLLKIERDKREAEVSKAISDAKIISNSIEERGWKLGHVIFEELVQSKKPVLDSNGLFHWPVVLLYPETMSSDLIEDFCEMDMFSNHMDVMYSESAPALSWDAENIYTREAIELYYEANSVLPMPKTKILNRLLEGTAGAGVLISDDDVKFDDSSLKRSRRTRWVKVDEKKRLGDVLKEAEYVIPGIPVFSIVSKRSAFHHTFVSGECHFSYDH